MADRVFAVLIKNVGTAVQAVVMRDPTTLPVASETGKVLYFESFKDQGFGGPGLALDGTADGRHPTFTVASATNATPIVATLDVTAASLGIVVGDTVSIAGGLVMTSINGTWFVSAVSGSTITLEGSDGNGALTASTAKGHKLNKGVGYHSVLSQVVQGILDEKSLNG